MSSTIIMFPGVERPEFAPAIPNPMGPTTRPCASIAHTPETTRFSCIRQAANGNPAHTLC